jgi:glyoxylase-like metal-dependent hydrolase (beta-lactamase superfamily II)
MTVKRVTRGLFQLIVPTPFPVGPVNVYLAVDEEGSLTLVDVGPRTKAAREALDQQLASLGYAVTDIRRIVITHAHTDHFGLAGDIVKVSGAVVYSHPLNQSMLEDYATERTRRGVFYADLLTEAGVPQDVRQTIIEALQGIRHFAASVAPVQPLNEGDEIQLAGQTWQTRFFPGHAGGLICLYQPESRLFLSNDHLLRDISSNPLFEPPLPGQTRRRHSLVDYIASLERTSTMDIAVAWPGHGEPIYDHRSLIQERTALHQRRAARLLNVLKDGPQSAYGLSQRIFGELNAMDRFLAVSEVLAHLEWLEDQGMVICQAQDGLGFWHTASAAVDTV